MQLVAVVVVVVLETFIANDPSIFSPQEKHLRMQYYLRDSRQKKNVRRVVLPRDLESMRGYDGKTTKTNMTDKFYFEFGASGEFSSCLDFAAKVLYKALSEKTRENNEE